MARRVDLQGISQNLASSFVSRNNDLHGYWALGFIQTHLKNGMGAGLTLNILNTDQQDEDGKFASVRKEYHALFVKHLQARKIPDAWIKSALIKVEGGQTETLGITVVIETDLGRKFTSFQNVKARHHDASRELRSGRFAN